MLCRVDYHVVMRGSSNRGFLGRDDYLVVMWDSSNIKQRVPLSVFTTMFGCGIHQTERLFGRVYYHVVMWDSSNRGFSLACWLPCCDAGFIKQKVPLGVMTTML